MPSPADRLGELLERVLALTPPERPVFLEQACAGDPALRAELESLLAAHTAAPAYLERLAEQVLPVTLRLLLDDEFPPGSVIGRYRILEYLGGGGMGVVYKARDLQLDRLVALKFLPARLTADAHARARLRAEARAASALDHPNIAVIYEIGSASGPAQAPDGDRLFIAMAYYAGETLEQRIARGPFSIAETLDIGLQMADGLAAAHHAGIIHCDIKPSNVVFTGRGQVRILDFGVAQLAGKGPAAAAGRQGTVAYMSPEQLLGNGPDPRADLWSLGVVLYEMLTGARPFDEARGLHGHEPLRIETARPDAPPELARLVHRCLAREAAARPAGAAALCAALHTITGTGPGRLPPAAAREGLVVLPFANLSPDPDNEYFSDGLTEEVIADLARLGALRVISRTSSMRLKGSARDVHSIARELGVRYVLEGSVRKAGDSLRVSAQLVDAHRDGHLWADSFDGTLAEVFVIQQQVARAIVRALRIHLSAAEMHALADRPIRDARAYESFLRARYEAWRFTSEGLARAQRYIEDALEIVGDNQLLYSTLGHITAMHLEAGIDLGDSALDRVAELAEKVFSLSPRSARGYWLKAFVALQRGDLHEGIEAGSMAQALAPDDADTLILLGYIYAHAGRNAEARRLFERAVDVDPLTPVTQCMPGFVAVMEGRFDAAVEPYRRFLALDPDSPFAAVTCGWALAYSRRQIEALATLETASSRFPGTVFAAWARGLAAALRGDTAEARAAITPAFEQAARHSEMFARELAHLYALAGCREEALDWLESAIGLGMLNHEFLARHDWFLDSVREEARFAALMERVRAAAAELATV